jgi:hypothetical protein
MTSFLDQHIKCFLRNSTVAEGIVISWTDKEIQLQSLDGKSILIIHHPAQDIVLTKVMLPQEMTQKCEELSNIDFSPQNVEIAPQDQTEDPMFLRAKSAAQLRVELAQQERRIIAGKLKDHHSTEAPRKINYGYPRFFPKPRT